MMRIVVLGSGGSLPSVERNPMAIAIRFEGNVYLMDCGEGTQRQMMKCKMSYAKTKAIFITHLHADHYLGVLGLIETLGLIGRKEPLYIFGPKGVSRKIASNEDFVIVKEIDENFSYREENFTVRAFKTSHTMQSFGFCFDEKKKRNFEEDKTRSLGIKGKLFGILEKEGKVELNGKTIRYEDVSVEKKGRKISYTGDTSYDERILPHIQDSDVLFHDATFAEEHAEEARAKQHSTAKQAAQMAELSNSKKLILVHISNRYENNGSKKLENEAREAFSKSFLAYDGMEIKL